MRKSHLTLSAIALILVFTACKKSSTTSNAKTVQNLSGSYMITAINVNALGINFDEFATWDACQKDNIIKLNTDMSVDYIDAGTKCVPPEDSTGTWSLSSNADSIGIEGTSALIQSWDGKTLVLTGAQEYNNQQATTTITLFKQ